MLGALALALCVTLQAPAPVDAPDSTERRQDVVAATPKHPPEPLEATSTGPRGPPQVEVFGALLGGALGLLPWVPTLGVCCASSSMMAAVYPMSAGDPVVGSGTLWPYACALGVFVGMGGWLMAHGGALASSFLTGGGVAGGVGLARARLGRLGTRPLVAGTVGALLGGMLMMPGAVVAAALSGFLPWATVFVWIIVANGLPRDGYWMYGRWFALNGLYMSSVVAGLALLGVSAAIPLGGALGAWLVTSSVVPEERSGESILSVVGGS